MGSQQTSGQDDVRMHEIDALTRTPQPPCDASSGVPDVADQGTVREARRQPKGMHAKRSHRGRPGTPHQLRLETPAWMSGETSEGREFVLHEQRIDVSRELDDLLVYEAHGTFTLRPNAPAAQVEDAQPTGHALS
jgi:hypothetical protein